MLSLQTRPRAWGTRGHRRPHVPPTRDPRRPPTRGPPRPPTPIPAPLTQCPSAPLPPAALPAPRRCPGLRDDTQPPPSTPTDRPDGARTGRSPPHSVAVPKRHRQSPPPALGHPLPSTPPPTHPPVSSSPLTLRPRWHRTHGDGTVETHGRDGTRRDARRSPIGSARGAERNTGGQSARRPPPDPRRPPTDPPTPLVGPPTPPVGPPDGPPTLPAGPPPPPAGPPPPLTHLRRPREPRERRRGAAPRRGARPSPSRLQDPSRSPGAAAPELRPPQPPLSVRIAPPPPPPVAVRPDPAREEELPAPPPTAPPADTAPPVTPNGRGGGGSDAPPRLRAAAVALPGGIGRCAALRGPPAPGGGDAAPACRAPRPPPVN